MGKACSADADGHIGRIGRVVVSCWNTAVSMVGMEVERSLNVKNCELDIRTNVWGGYQASAISNL